MVLILWLSNVPILITSIFGVIKLNSVSIQFRPIIYFCFISLIFQVAGAILWLLKLNNLFLLHFFVPISFGILIWFYNYLWSRYLSTGITFSLIILFVLLSIFNVLFNQHLSEFNSLGSTAQSVLLIVFSISTYFLMLENSYREEFSHLYRSISWVNSGIFLFYTSSLIAFYLGDTIMDNLISVNLSRLAWVPHAVFITVMYVCFFIGLWKSPKRQKSFQP